MATTRNASRPLHLYGLLLFLALMVLVFSLSIISHKRAPSTEWRLGVPTAAEP